MVDIKNKKLYITGKLLFNLMLIIIGAVLIWGVLNNVQTQASIRKQQENNELALSEVVSLLEKNAENSQTLTEVFHDGNWKILDNINQVFDNGLFNKIVDNDNTVRSQVFKELSASSGISYLYLLDDQGKVVMSPEESMYGLHLATTPIMTQENINDLLKYCRKDDGSINPVLVKNIYGSYYFYSKPYVYEDTEYVLVFGTNSSVLDDSLASLKDVSTVLSRMRVINNGFLFAINRKDNIFTYFKSEDDFLTGQNALTTGITEDIYIDGYQGNQTILGTDYYCTSKTFGDDTIIVATAKDNAISSYNKYVVLWSVMGFLVVMFLSLIYGVIVRNDFIRQGVTTDKQVLFETKSGPIYYDRSLFNKVTPLMLLGVLVVFGISFYTQTLLEIAQGVDRSKVILQEVTGRYEENQESSDIIEDYFNSRFLSAAKLIAFYVEENPSVLNGSSEFFHSSYDEVGNRQFVYDDEGNRLKSIANSPLLQQLCADNSIEAIYIFDESGHTIATNTNNWFFTLSTNPEDQSYPFRQVLEGKLDSYLQSSMTDDLGESAQFFGISFNYYTKKDELGNTVYVSRYDFEETAAREGLTDGFQAGGITKHRSLLQIELDENLTGLITRSTSPENILSTRMLGDGIIAMFDNSPEHICVYHPNRASIGKTAEELGVYSKAFTGNVFYGFTRINGDQYFQYFHFAQDYFIATAIPKASMVTGRTAISLITSGICLVLITILLGTITLSTQQEEELFKLINDGYVDEDLNSSIFNLMLPSGRLASTTRALARWDNKHIPWNSRSPEMKLGTIIGWICAIPAMYFVLSAFGIKATSSQDSVITYILSMNWQRSPNVFALSSSIMVIIITIIITNLFKVPVRLCTSLLGTRGETIGHLLLSIVKYGSVIGALFYCLYLFGIDSPNLIASAGIMSLVIGLGAQSLIKDILAGIFIVFESEFRVGDIVTIGNFRGTVTDIGLRTTKISGGGNVKIFNNSEISGVLNMTKETSVASATIGLEYGQDIDYVDEVLNRELPNLKQENAMILDGPTNLGVSELGEKRFTVTVTARCQEKNVGALNRFLNKSLIQIFSRNGIRIANQKTQ